MMQERTTLPVRKATRDKLKTFGGKGASYDVILRRLMEIAEEAAFYSVLPETHWFTRRPDGSGAIARFRPPRSRRPRTASRFLGAPAGSPRPGTRRGRPAPNTGIRRRGRGRGNKSRNPGGPRRTSRTPPARNTGSGRCRRGGSSRIAPPRRRTGRRGLRQDRRSTRTRGPPRGP